MRLLTLLLIAPAAFALTACHSQGGYMSADPKLTYGPGVVEFPDPARVYLPEYRRGAMATTETVEITVPATPTYTASAPAVRPVRVSARRPDPSASVRVTTPSVVARAPTTTLRTPANVRSIRGDSMRGAELMLDRPVAPRAVSAPNIDEIRVRGERMPEHMISGTGTVVTAPPKGAPLPAPTNDRPFKETELVVTPGGVYTR